MTGLLVASGIVAALVVFLLVGDDPQSSRPTSLAAAPVAGARDPDPDRQVAPELREVESARGTALRPEPIPEDGAGAAGALPTEAEAQAPHPLDQAKEDLAFHTTVALDGVLYLDDVLDQMLKFASLEVSEHPDFDYEDDDAIAYELLGGPEGVDAWMLVGLQPYEENGRTYRYLQMEVSMLSNELEFLDGALREGPYIHLGISYDTTDPGAPTRFGVTLQRPVDMHASRREGIDAYQGRYTIGARYWHDLLDGRKSATTTGIIDGNPVQVDVFGGLPLHGTTDLDVDRLRKLLGQLQANLSLVKGE